MLKRDNSTLQMLEDSNHEISPRLLAIAAMASASIVTATDVGPPSKIAERWSPHPTATPLTAKQAGTLAAQANGTRTITGGWQWRSKCIAVRRDALRCIAAWGKAEAHQERSSALWDYLLPEVASRLSRSNGLLPASKS